MDRLIIFDTTLRDGEQSPGATLNVDEKLEIAKQLTRLGVDVIEAGFAFASPGDFEAVSQVARTVGTEEGPVICSLARAMRPDIQAAAEAIKPAAHGRIHTFISTSDIHLEHQLRKSRAEVLDIAGEMVAYARSFVDNVQFSPMDAGRSDPAYLWAVLERAIEAGATTINIPDTVGYLTPVEFGALMGGIRQNVRGVEKIVLSTHCHNDLGLAVANSLAGVEHGARQVECTINGIGERAGNCSLEEIVMVLHVRRQFFNPVFGRPADSPESLCRIDTRQIYKTSRMVSTLTGMLVQPNKAIVGANAFAHESGIHQDGVLKNRLTYEIVDAETIGLNENRIVLGKHSGRNAFRTRLRELGYELNETDLNRAFLRFKELADKKKSVGDLDIEAIVSDEIRLLSETYRLEQVQVVCGDHATPTATVRLVGPEGTERTAAAVGTGPVDATFKALASLIDLPNELVEYSVQSVTAGIDAMGEVTVRVRQGSRTFLGHSANTDVIVASARAYLNALNKLHFALANPTHTSGALGDPEAAAQKV